VLHAVTVEKPAAKTGTVPQEGCPPEPDEPKPESIGSIADRWKREREEREERQLQSESSRATAPAKHEGAQRASQHKLEEITHTSNFGTAAASAGGRPRFGHARRQSV
jgi:hypothetical protein